MRKITILLAAKVAVSLPTDVPQRLATRMEQRAAVAWSRSALKIRSVHPATYVRFRAQSVVVVVVVR